MKKNLILEDLINYVKKIDNSYHNINKNSKIFEEGYIDSYELVEFILYIKKKYKIDIGNLDFYSEYKNLKSIADYLDSFMK